MTLPAPNLDDRRFQDLVDDAKRMIQRKWPEWSGWTDHNVSDPGVTLIETVAFMVDQLLYRLNRVPDLHFVKFLELIGLQLQAPTAATVPVTFWLSAPQGRDVVVPEGTEVATERGDLVDPVVFRTQSDLDIVSVRRTAVGSAASSGAGEPMIDLTDALDVGGEIALFTTQPAPGNSFYVGLSHPAPGCAVVIRVGGEVEGYGINPDRPPIRWQAWTGSGWSDCAVERDGTGGFNRAGDVLLHVPNGHRVSTVGQRRAAWLRCVVTAPAAAGDEQYGASPRVDRVDAFTIGGTIDCIHGEVIRGEILGNAEGSAGQQLQLQHVPVVLSPDPEILDVIIDASVAGRDQRNRDHLNGDADEQEDRVEEWVRVDTFAGSVPADRCFTIEPATGVVRMPVAVREVDGTARFYGAVPPAGSMLRMRSYRTGGGREGNVAAGTLRSLRSSVPLISSVINRVAASGGVDSESLDDAKLRGPLMLRTRDRAVTGADFEHLAREAAPEIARVRCADAGATEAGSVRVLIVPRVDDTSDGSGRVTLAQLRPRNETFERITETLEERRVIGVRIVVEMPTYSGVTVVARLKARRRASPVEVERLALDALYGYYHPVSGGPEGQGWPFGRPIQAGEVHAVLQRVPGVDFVEEALLFTYDIASGQRGSAPTERIEIPANGLVFSFGHQARVDQGS